MVANVATTLLAYTAISATFRPTYFMQMHDRLGPIIIHYTKVVLDVVTMAFIFAVTILAFSFAMIHVLSSQLVLSDSEFALLGNLTEASPVEIGKKLAELLFDDYGYTFQRTVELLFWAIMDPGPAYEFFSTNTTKGQIGSIIFAIFQVQIVKTSTVRYILVFLCQQT